MTRARAVILGLLALMLAAASASTQVTPRVTSPRQHFGAAIGDDFFLASYSQIESYWQQLDRESDRMTLVDIGRTEEGRSQWMAVLTAPENLAKLARYREIARRLTFAEGLTDGEARALAAEGRTVVVIAGGLHADELVGSQQLVELVYQLATRTDAETQRILRDVIVLVLHANPDGNQLVAEWYMREPDPNRRSVARLPRLYQKYIGHDINRDFFMSTQAETRNINRVLYEEWFPQVVYDHHQSAPSGTVMFAPPFHGPFNYRLDPLIASGIDLIGGAMHSRFAIEQKPGVTLRSGSNYSTWWNGGLRTAPYFHNQIGILTEIIGGPTPVRIPVVADRQVPGPDLPFPVRPQTWHFRQSIDYSMTANLAVLDAASRHRESLLFNIYRMGRAAIEQGSRDHWTPTPRRPNEESDPDQRDPRGYILRADQPDFLTATKFANALLRSGVLVERGTGPFVVDGKSYPAGSLVVRAAQAFRPQVLDMFEPQDHPPPPLEAGLPVAPYDNAGWTLAFQMGVQFDRILDAFDGPFERVAGQLPVPAGQVSDGPGTIGYTFSRQQNDAFIVVNRLLKAGEKVYAMRSAGSSTFFVPATVDAITVLRRAAAELGVTFRGVARAPRGKARALKMVRVGLWDQAGGNVDSGWLRWLLERYEFAFEVIADDLFDADDLAERYDVLLFPRTASPDRHVKPLLRFVEAGGTLVAIGGATAIAPALGLPVSDATADLPPQYYFIPGSILRVSVNPEATLAHGLAGQVDVMFDRSPVLRLGAGAERAGIVPVAWFSSALPLRSGWASGQELIHGGAAVVDAPLGAGRVLLFGPEITFRGQSHGTFKFLFNALHYGTPVSDSAAD